MQFLFGLCFASVILAALLLGHSLSQDYTPYATMLALPLYCYGLCIPFLGEYNSLNQTFSGIGRNFNNLMRTEKAKEKGHVDIFVPHNPTSRPMPHQEKAPQHNLFLYIFIVTCATALMGYDIVSHYILGHGLTINSGPISNF